MAATLFTSLSLLLIFVQLSTQQENRTEKVFNVLNVVQFPNAACTMSDGLIGTCYTDTECTALGGTAKGDCASGFGVCCEVSTVCGEKITVNNTYFMNKEVNFYAETCSASICRANDNICQIRLDFVKFEMDQPELKAASDTSRDGSTQCQKSTFALQSDTGRSTTICGKNTGEHMIVESIDPCNELKIEWTTSSKLRDVNIRVSFIECTDRYKAPEGCTQYYTGQTGTVYSYNFQGGIHLANQEYTICIRREEGYCSIAYHADTFEVSGTDTTGTIGQNCLQQDYVYIPRVGPGLDTNSNNFDRLCGALFTNTASGSSAATLYTKRTPFVIGVSFDEAEAAPSGALDAYKGFAITWNQQPNCT